MRKENVNQIITLERTYTFWKNATIDINWVLWGVHMGKKTVLDRVVGKVFLRTKPNQDQSMREDWWHTMQDGGKAIQVREHGQRDQTRKYFENFKLFHGTGIWQRKEAMVSNIDFILSTMRVYLRDLRWGVTWSHLCLEKSPPGYSVSNDWMRSSQAGRIQSI